MPKATATLYGYHRSSTSYRLRILFGIKKIDYHTEVVRLDRGEQHAATFKDINPMGGVPVVRIDGRTLVQSPAIIDYIEEQYQQPVLLPDDPDTRQRVREITSLIGCDIHPVNNLRVLKRLRAEHGFDDAAIGEWYRHWINTGFSALEAMIDNPTARYAVGASVSLAEIYLVPQIYNARRFDVDMAQYPALQSIDAQCAKIDAFRDAHPDLHAPSE